MNSYLLTKDFNNLVVRPGFHSVINILVQSHVTVGCEKIYACLINVLGWILAKSHLICTFD